MDTFNNNDRFEWFASGNAPLLYPAEMTMGEFLFEDFSKLSIPESDVFATTWGKPVSKHILLDNFHPAPKYIILSWLSFVEKKCYAVADELPKEQIEDLFSERNGKTKKPAYRMIVVGIAPFGNVAVWLAGEGMTTHVAWLKGKEVPARMNHFAPKSKNLTREEYVEQVLAENKAASENLRSNGLPDPMLFERYMQRFNYRITPKFEHKIEFDGIEMYYYNGELNTSQSGEHAACALRAKPGKIVLNWRMGKHLYRGYFWTDENRWLEAFANGYGGDAQQEGNLIIEVGASHQEFQFTLQTPVASIRIPAEDIQYIIFKNNFEFHRSPNYNRPPQSWRS